MAEEWDAKVRVSEKERERERERLRNEEQKDLEVENNRGPRPLEGFAGGHTSWTASQDDEEAAKVHADDDAKARKLSEEQVERLAPSRNRGE